MDHLHTANKVCGGCCAISLNTVDTESSVSPNTGILSPEMVCTISSEELTAGAELVDVTE